MQYYREIITRPELADHLADKNRKRIRYAQTCRDLAITIPEDLVGLHSAIASQAVRRVAEDANATISVWRSARPERQSFYARRRQSYVR